jgi:two-component system cell cycle sensor histidine kinase/response regulator CckA
MPLETVSMKTERAASAPSTIATTDLATLIGHSQSVDSMRTLNDVHDAFGEAGPAYLGVVAGQRLVGICSRAVIGHALGARYGVALFGKQSVSDFLIPGGLIVRVGTPMLAVLEAALSRPSPGFNDDVALVADNGDYLGLIPTHTLVHMQSHLVTEQIRMIEAQRLGAACQNAELLTLTQELNKTNLELGAARDAALTAKDRAQRYLDTAEVILLALDLDGRITLANRYACAVLGWPSDALLNRDWFETCVPAGVRNAVRQTFDRVVGGNLSIGVNSILTRSGEERLIEWRDTLLRDAEGRVVGTFSSGADITERKQTELALGDSERRFRATFEQAGIGVAIVDSDGHPVEVNAALRVMLGYSAEELAGMSFGDFTHPEDRGADWTLFRELFSGSRNRYSLEKRYIRKDLQQIWGRLTVSLVRDASDRPQYAVAMVEDITKQRQVEEQFRQAQKMEAIGRLAGGVAHDFNNLLSVILGYCELLLVDVDRGDPRQADIAEIHKAGTSAAGLTRQLLAFSRKQIIEPVRLDLNVVVADMRQMLGRLIGETVKVVLGLGLEAAPVMADRGQMEQIVMNLTVNARDAMPRGGTLTIEIGNVHLDDDGLKAHSALKRGPYVVLTVSDTGTGMTPQVQARLFEPFFTTKEPGKGTGLGLATVYGIVERSGGSVGVYSEVGTGTSFKVYFPRSDAAEMVVQPPAPVTRPGAGSKTVLVVDDAEGLRNMARRLLQQQGYTVLVAANADEALTLFERNGSIDVLLTDVVMPGASGPELTKQLIERRPTLRVVYMSGYTDEAIVHHGILEPGVIFLNKPFTSETLGQKVRDALDR